MVSAQRRARWSWWRRQGWWRTDGLTKRNNNGLGPRDLVHPTSQASLASERVVCRLVAHETRFNAYVSTCPDYTQTITSPRPRCRRCRYRALDRTGTQVDTKWMCEWWTGGRTFECIFFYPPFDPQSLNIIVINSHSPTTTTFVACWPLEILRHIRVALLHIPASHHSSSENVSHKPCFAAAATRFPFRYAKNH